MLRLSLSLVLASIAVVSSASKTTYRYEGYLTQYSDPVYDGQPPVTDGSVKVNDRFSGTFTMDTTAFQGSREITLNLGKYSYTASSSAFYPAASAASLTGDLLSSPQIVRPIPQDEYNFLDLQFFAAQGTIDRLSQALPVNVGLPEIAGSDFILQVIWRDPRNNPQALQVRGQIDKIEAVPEPMSMAALGVGALGLLKRRKKA